MNWGNLVARGKDAYPKYKQGKKARDYWKLVRGAVDEDTRRGSLMKLGIKVTIDIASKLLGSSLSSHPYFKFHKVHLDVLASALNATGTKELAEQAFHDAIKAADSTVELARMVETLEGQRKLAVAAFGMSLRGSLLTLREAASGNTTALKQTGLAQPQFEQITRDQMYEHRCAWAGLSAEALQLALMVEADYRATETAMKRYDEKVRKLKTSGSIGKIAGYRVEQDRMWAQYDAMTKPQTAKRSSYDPLGAAAAARQSVTAIVEKITATTDLVFDDDVLFNRPDTIAATF